ncbi:uncharacterized protein CMU_008500 [Cryptosporidium muris RN66]|uniref:TATA element modulatory factor 1 TATA binding domain-containing protein n=1 Tax=Cryptosporidium muris (strain RN66) TaxID=441375 RepID=B6ADR8_CRYMR|nr:uncharacterized protein CMU_008500 [Cryptosporidium muris RN66]EEA06359.1 hypothetical protein, conserved [Cryptosporidium muris RN66]|eukprot:XP_002140708.1 hypothetical protein [Cryptosporidium muris RN66]
MQSFFKSAIDKVSTIKDVVEHSIEEAVKNNQIETVFLSGTSISSNVINWTESDISKRASNLKYNTTSFVGDLALSIRDAAANLTIRQTEVDNSQKNFQIGKSLCYNKNNSLNSIEFKNEISNNLIKDMKTRKKSALDIRNTVSSHLSSNIEYIEDRNLNDDKNIELNESQIYNNTTEITKNSMHKESDIVLDENFEEVDKSTISNIIEGIGDILLNDTTEGIKQSGNIESNFNYKDEKDNTNDINNCNNETFNLTKDCSDLSEINEGNPDINNLDFKSEDYGGLIKVDNFDIDDSLYNNKVIKSKMVCDLDKNNNLKKEKNVKKDLLASPILNNGIEGSVLNPLSMFQEVNNLENLNLVLKKELGEYKGKYSDIMKNYHNLEKKMLELSSEYKKIIGEKRILKDRLLKIKENKNLIVDLQTQVNTLTEKLEFRDNTIQEYIELNKCLREKIGELEITLSSEESRVTESLNSYQAEITELRYQLSKLQIDNKELVIPYIERINILESQLGETKKRQTHEQNRYESIIQKLKIESKEEKEFLKLKIKKLEDFLLQKEEIIKNNNTYINRLNLEIQSYKAENLNKNLDNTHTNTHKLIIERNNVSLNIEPSSIKDTQDIPVIDKELSRASVKSPLSSKYDSNISISSLRDELRRTIIDRQVIEEEYIKTNNAKIVLENTLKDEEYRNKLLRQQLDSILAVVSNLQEKLEEANETILLQKKEITSIYLRITS